MYCDTDGGEPKYWEKNLFQYHLVHDNPTWTDLRMNPDLRG
jgi:hypothetical protein